MSLDIYNLGALFALLGGIGFFLAYLYGRKTKQFRWSEYIAVIILPLLGTVLIGILYDVKVFLLFFYGAITGFILEYILGLTYHRTLNKRLWIYGSDRFSLPGGYTNWLTIPMWGIAAVVFWLVSEFAGL